MGDFPEERAKRNLNDTLWRLKKNLKDNGPLLYELEEPWLEEIRISYRNKLREAKIELIKNYKTVSEYVKAINVSKSALNDNPYDESLAHELILLYYLKGNTSQALKEFMFDGIKVELVKKLELETGGNPLFLKETIRYWLEMIILDFNKNSNTWSYNLPLNYPNNINEELWENFNIPEKISNVFKTLISILNNNQKEFVEYAAVLGYRFNIDILKNVLKRNEEEFIDIIDTLIKKGFFSETQEDNIVRFSHRKVCYMK